MKYCLSFIFVILFLNTNAQRTVTSRLRIDNGGSVNFFFNTIGKMQTGITYTEWTQLSIYYKDTTAVLPDPVENWVLDVKARTPDMEGAEGNTLDLRTIQLVASGGGGNTYAAKQFLTNLDFQQLAKGQETAPGVTKVKISYFCGEIGSGFTLLGKKPDFYTVDIIFTLRPEIAP
jgi:hypothetical protein